MQDILNLIKTRRSVRRYQNKPVPKDLILKLIEAARWAPTGANFQPWKFIIVTDENIKREISKYAKFYFIKSHHVFEAPVVIAICGNTKRTDWYKIDCALAGQNIMLMAHSLGLGSCWVGAFDEQKIKEALKVPEPWSIVGLITIGYTAETPSIPPRLDLEEVVGWETFEGGFRKPRISQAVRSGPVSVWNKILKVLFRF